MPSDTTYLYFQRGRDYSADPGWTNKHGVRGSSVPRTGAPITAGLARHRASSLPPPQFSNVVSALNGGRGATVQRRASISLPYGQSLQKHRAGGHSFTPSLTYATSSKGSIVPVYSYTGVPLTSIHSYSPSKGSIVISAPQRFSPATAIKSLAAARPTSFYRAPSSSRGGAQGSRDWSTRRATSTNRERVDNGYPKITSANRERVDNGHAQIRIVLNKDKVDNGHKTLNYEIKANPFLANQTASLSELKSRAEVARTQLSKHRVLLDRYLPISLEKPTAVDDVIANKYGELLIRMPELEYRHRPNNSLEEPPAPLIIAPYTPAYTKHHKIDKEEALALPPVRNSFTPKISDTRKHARRVLCKIKGDPKYFDYS